jgi:uncharacterized membrane protein YcgQ (UPF0703/DUF1980 family)
MSNPRKSGNWIIILGFLLFVAFLILCKFNTYDWAYADLNTAWKHSAFNYRGGYSEANWLYLYMDGTEADNTPVHTVNLRPVFAATKVDGQYFIAGQLIKDQILDGKLFMYEGETGCFTMKGVTREFFERISEDPTSEDFMEITSELYLCEDKYDSGPINMAEDYWPERFKKNSVGAVFLKWTADSILNVKGNNL